MITKLLAILKQNKILLVIIFLGLVLRLWNYKELYMFAHDQDLQGWFIKDVLVNHHLRLIGQETSTEGIFIGPLFYYLLIPFYILTRFDPIGGLYFTILLGLVTVASIYFVFAKILNKNTAIIGSAIYALSFYTIFNDKEVVPTMPVILWTVWFMFGIYLILKKKRWGLPFVSFLLALSWNFNVALVLLLPVVVVALILTKSKLDLKTMVYSAIIFILTSAPFVLFEIRHDFIEIRSLVTAFTTNQEDVVTGLAKFVRTLNLMSKNAAGLLWGSELGISNYWAGLVLVGSFFYAVYKKVLSKKYLVIFLTWFAVYFVFFSLYSKRLSEYYLNGLIIVFIAVLASAISLLIKNANYKYFGYLVIIFLCVINLDRMFSFPINKSGYVQRTELVNAIKTDSVARGYPCVAISYITDLGYDRGYRYLIWHAGLKTKPISDSVPVYTIVFPLKDIFKQDKSFGALGLINPNYSQYDAQGVNSACRGEDYNLTDPMIGLMQ